MPLALAILLSFVLAPLVLLLRRWHFGRVGSVLAAVLLAGAILAGLGTMIVSQLTRLAAELPRYEFTIRDKANRLGALMSQSGAVESATAVLKGVTQELQRAGEEAREKGAPPPTAAPSDSADGPPPPKPIPVEVHQPPPSPLQTIVEIAGPLLYPLALTGIVVVFVIFILLQREDLRDRLIRLFGSRDLHRTTEALDDAAYRLSRYFLTQLGISTVYGIVIAAALFAPGVPNAILWGIVAILMRFVPYVGSFIAAGGPVLLAIAVDPGWSMALATVALFAVGEFTMGQVVEPWVYGQRTGVSSLAVILSATFWTWLWGPVGLLLAMPLTVCLVVLGRHVEPLQFLDVLLGDRPALAPEQTFYQRMRAGDPAEAVDQAEACLATRPLITYYDEVALRGLALAQRDTRGGRLDAEAQARVVETVGAVIDELADEPDEAPPLKPAKEPSPASDAAAADDPRLTAPPVLRPDDLRPDWRSGGASVACIAGANALDEAAAAMLAQILRKHGVGARVISCEAVSAGRIRQLDLGEVRFACLSFLDPHATSQARHLVRRLRRHGRDLTILVGFWAGGAAGGADLRAATGADLVATSLREAVDAVLLAARQPAAPDTDIPPAAPRALAADVAE